MISYKTNWMGPISMNWYRARNLTKKVTKVLEKDSIIHDKKAGETIEVEIITEHWSGGRIGIHGTSTLFGEEMALSTMHGEDFNRFSEWLETFTTDTVWSLEAIVAEYEKTNPKIRWASDVF